MIKNTEQLYLLRCNTYCKIIILSRIKGDSIENFKPGVCPYCGESLGGHNGCKVEEVIDHKSCDTCYYDDNCERKNKLWKHTCLSYSYRYLRDEGKYLSWKIVNNIDQRSRLTPPQPYI